MAQEERPERIEALLPVPTPDEDSYIINMLTGEIIARRAPRGPARPGALAVMRDRDRRWWDRLAHAARSHWQNERNA